VAQDAERVGRSRLGRLRVRIESTLAARVSPERTRRATLFERLTVRRLSWDTVVRLNRYLEIVGKTATAIWCVFIASVVLGVDWRDSVAHAIRSASPIEHVFVLTIVVPTLVFLLARSTIGFLRWRLQRELWRRDVERLDDRVTRRG
jgi:hypothetical protein